MERFVKVRIPSDTGGTLSFLPVGDKIASCHTRKRYEITDLGIMHPEEVPTTQLLPGQVGYIACNMKQSSEGTRPSVHTLSRSHSKV